jgi:hypothetical protein
MAEVTVRRATLQTCAVCGQVLDADCQARESDEVAFVGAARYAWCVACGRQVRQPWTHGYRDRWDRYARECREHQPNAQTRPVKSPATPYVCRLVDDEGITLRLTITLDGAGFLVRWYRGNEPEAQEHCRTWEEAVNRADEMRVRLERRGFRAHS